MTPDMINGVFELFGGVFLFNNCRILYHHKSVKGISMISVAFFMSWGYWNLYYYPHLGQWWSFAGGTAIVAAYILWIAMAIHYRRKETNGRTHT